MTSHGAESSLLILQCEGCGFYSAGGGGGAPRVVQFMAKAVPFAVFPPAGCRVCVEVGTGETEDSAARIQQELLGNLELPEKGAWHMLETWKGCERRVPPSEHLLPLWEEWGDGEERVGTPRFCLKLPPQSKQLKKRRRIKTLHKRLAADPKILLSGKLTYRRLQWLHAALSQHVRRYQRQYSAVLLGRVGRREELWGPQEPTIMDVMKDELTSLQEQNLQLSTEVADLNITSTRLASQLTPLHQKVSNLSAKLAQLQCEVGGKREEKERREKQRKTEARTELLKLKRELDLRNRLNSAQNTKLENHKEMLSSKQQLLAEKQRELEQLKRKQLLATKKSHVTLSGRHVTPPKSTPHKEPSPPAGSTPPTIFPDHRTPSSTSPDHRTPSSTSKKRHSSIFEARHRQLREEEGLTFRESQARLHGDKKEGTTTLPPKSNAVKRLNFSSPKERDVNSTSASPESVDQDPSTQHSPEVAGSTLLAIPKADTLWYKTMETPTHSRQKKSERDSGMSESGTESCDGGMDQQGLEDDVAGEEAQEGRKEGGRKGGERKRGVRVRFAPQAVVLNSALEGELELLKQCVQELGSCSQTSEKGATCLHNAVCSGSLPTVEYLVEMGSDINAQDVDGWTPLHCAVAYSNLDMIRYLIGHGASLFLETTEGETPVKIGMEEYRLQQESQGGKTNEATVECLKYLTDIQNNLGLSNRSVVFALFSYQADDPEELGFCDGDVLWILDRGEREDQWWWAKNASGEKGYVPCTYLGTYQRHTVVL